MALVRTKKIFMYGLNADRKAVLEDLHKREAVEVIDLDAEQDGLKRQETMQSISQFDRFINAAKDALELLDKYAPEKTGFFSSRRVLPLSKYSMKSGKTEDAQKTAYEIIQLAEKIHENAENMRRIDAKQIALKPYLKLDVPMRETETKYAQIQSGLLDGMWTQGEIQKVLDEHELGEVHFEILEATKEITSVWFLYAKSLQKEMFSFFQSIGFQEPAFSLSHRIPTDKVAVLEQAKKELEVKSKEYEKTIGQHGGARREIELWYDHLVMRKEKYEALSMIGLTESTFVMEGYVLEPDAEKVKKELEESYSVYVELQQPDPEENPPVTFKNNGFVRPVEGVTRTYSMPGQGDVDPNPIMAFFYYFFFGMMFSDAGYGLLMTIACAILGYGKVLEPGKRNSFKMFFFCGISTMFWGFMYGGFFGDATHTISSVFFGGDAVLQPLWMDPTQEPLTLLVFSIMLGLIHVLIGMGIKVYTLCRDKHMFEAISDHVIWMVILGFIFVMATGMFLSNSGITVPAIVNTIGLYGLIAGLVALVALKTIAGVAIRKKNIIAALGGGILSIYDITGFIGDILSYSRLLALGLATGVIANVVNMMGTLLGNTPVGIIFFVVVFILGHIVNFALNALGAYVHTMRLQYVEYYAKFYEGGGEPFRPFKMDTKYYKFANEK
ncbi:V-type ATP synthase subunit I [Christensenellaceae bacterium OttesenSCG-928-K19]|nr:V-type ATP synthase subunit I [Christensenellaceae bacterium OttesenSCG-928-K19]